MARQHPSNHPQHPSIPASQHLDIFRHFPGQDCCFLFLFLLPLLDLEYLRYPTLHGIITRSTLLPLGTGHFTIWLFCLRLPHLLIRPLHFSNEPSGNVTRKSTTNLNIGKANGGPLLSPLLALDPLNRFGTTITARLTATLPVLFSCIEARATFLHTFSCASPSRSSSLIYNHCLTLISSSSCHPPLPSSLLLSLGSWVLSLSIHLPPSTNLELTSLLVFPPSCPSSLPPRFCHLPLVWWPILLLSVPLSNLLLSLPNKPTNLSP